MAPDNSLVADLLNKLPGRGLWAKADRKVLEQGISGGQLASAAAKSAGTRVAVPTDLPDRIETALAARLCELIGLAYRSGQIIFGHEKVHDLLKREKAAALIAAADASVDQIRKLASLQPGIPEIRILDRAELSLALGRENVVHAALKFGGLARRIEADARRLAGFRALDRQSVE